MTAQTSAVPVIGKLTDWKRNYFWDFSKQPEIVAGDSIASVSAISPSGVNGNPPDGSLSIGAPIIDAVNSKIYAFIQGGTPGTQTLLECVIVTDGAKSGAAATIAKSYILAVQ